MNKLSVTKETLKKIAKEIGELAVQFQDALDTNKDTFSLANELAKKNITFVFVMGEFSAAKDFTPVKSFQRKTKVVSNPNNTAVTRTYVRDTFGRFASLNG